MLAPVAVPCLHRGRPDNGIKWQAVPADFPAWGRVYALFSSWRCQGLIGEFHDRLRGRVRQTEGRAAEPTAAIVDSQSVRVAATVPAVSRGYDAGKKVMAASGTWWWTPSGCCWSSR